MLYSKFMGQPSVKAIILLVAITLYGSVALASGKEEEVEVSPPTKGQQAIPDCLSLKSVTSQPGNNLSYKQLEAIEDAEARIRVRVAHELTAVGLPEYMLYLLGRVPGRGPDDYYSVKYLDGGEQGIIVLENGDVHTEVGRIGHAQPQEVGDLPQLVSGNGKNYVVAYSGDGSGRVVFLDLDSREQIQLTGAAAGQDCDISDCGLNDKTLYYFEHSEAGPCSIRTFDISTGGHGIYDVAQLGLPDGFSELVSLQFQKSAQGTKTVITYRDKDDLFNRTAWCDGVFGGQFNCEPPEVSNIYFHDEGSFICRRNGQLVEVFKRELGEELLHISQLQGIDETRQLNIENPPKGINALAIVRSAVVSVDEISIPTHFLLTRGIKDSKKLPAMIWLHDGRINGDEFNTMFEYCVSELNMVVVVPNFARTGGNVVSPVTAVINFVNSLPYIGGDKVLVCGFSDDSMANKLQGTQLNPGFVKRHKPKKVVKEIKKLLKSKKSG